MSPEEAESLEFQAFLYASPPDFTVALSHRKANLIFKDCTSVTSSSLLSHSCECCGKTIGYNPPLTLNYHTLQLSIYGPGIPLFFLFFKAVIFFLGLYTCVFVIYALISNINGDYCNENCGDYSWQNKMSILNVLNNQHQIIIQKYLLLSLAIYTIIHIVFLRRKMRKLEIHIDNFLITPSDFSIIIRHIPKNVCLENIHEMINDIIDFLEPQEKKKTEDLAVIEIINIYKIQQFLKQEKQNLKLMQKNLKKRKSDDHLALGACVPPKEFSHTAIVIFNRAKSKDYFLCEPSGKEKCIKYLWKSYFPKSNVHRLNDQFVSIARAPEPDDIIWENCGKSNSELLKRRIGCYLLSFSVLVCGGLIQYGIEILRKEYMVKQEETAQVAFSLVISSTVTLINFLIVQMLIFTVKTQKYDNQTQKKVALTFRMVTFQFLNSGIFMVLTSLLVKFFYQHEQNIQLSFITSDIVYFMIMNAIIQNIITIIMNYFEIFQKIKKFRILRNPHKYTQIDANKAFQAPEIEIEFKYAYIFKTFWLTVFFMPLTPIVVVISFVGLSINFVIEKYLFSGRYTAPEMISQYLNSHIMNLLDFTILNMVLGSLLVHLTQVSFKFSSLDSQILVPHYIGLILGIFNIFMPYRAIIKKLPNYQQQIQITSTYSQLKPLFQLNYQDTNPIYLNKKRRKIREKVHEKAQQIMATLALEQEDSDIF